MDPFNSSDIGQAVLNVDSIQQLWKDVMVLITSLESLLEDPAHMDHIKFKAEAKMWSHKFRLATFDEDVTPYIHCEYNS